MTFYAVIHETFFPPQIITGGIDDDAQIRFFGLLYALYGKTEGTSSISKVRIPTPGAAAGKR
jgi:hypothetical protein